MAAAQRVEVFEIEGEISDQAQMIEVSNRNAWIDAIWDIVNRDGAATIRRRNVPKKEFDEMENFNGWGDL